MNNWETEKQQMIETFNGKIQSHLRQYGSGKLDYLSTVLNKIKECNDQDFWISPKKFYDKLFHIEPTFDIRGF